MLNPEQLRTFLTAADCLNFTKAGESLHLSQPTVSQHIRELETRLEVTLFERRGRRVALTPAGERLRPFAKASLDQLERTITALDEFRGVPQSVLRLGASHTVGIYLLPQVLGLFSSRYPGIRASLQIGDPDMVLRGIQDGDLDMSLTSIAAPAAQTVGWSCRPFQDDELVLIASPNHPVTRRSGISLTDLVALPMIMRQSQSPTRQLILDAIAKVGVDPARLSIRFELGHTEGLKRAVMANLGVAFVSRYSIALEVAAGWLCVVPLPELRVTRSLWLTHRNAARLSVYEARFADLVIGHDWRPLPLP
jgi:DNA-binding transcriptional LysR family regulator